MRKCMCHIELHIPQCISSILSFCWVVVQNWGSLCKSIALTIYKVCRISSADLSCPEYSPSLANIAKDATTLTIGVIMGT